MSIFSKTLIQLRNRDNLTQEELARRIGVSKSHISMLENDKRKPSFESLEAIADYFNVNMDFLTTGNATSPLINPAGKRIHPVSDEEYINLVLPYRLASQDDKDAVDIIFRKYKKTVPSTGSTAI
ncbi:MAG: helix-turn-helix domain-containing protein [Oscillospiraceae bacterium]